MSARDPWVDGMVQEVNRRASQHMTEARDKVLALLPQMYHDSVRTLVDLAITEGQTASTQVLYEQGWFRPELGSQHEGDVEDEPFAHWPPHGSERACHEGDCRRCELEREHDEAAQR